MFGLPQPFVMSLVFSALMLAAMRFKIQWAPTKFAFVYLAAVIPGTLVAVFQGELEARSFAQLIVSLGVFAITASFFTKWLDLNSEDATKAALQAAILFFMVFGIAEILFYEAFYEFRVSLFGNLVVNASYRDIALYWFPRPTGLFSEASNFARFAGILAAAYMIVSRCSGRSLIYLVALMLLTRSPSFLFAAPAMALAIMAANPTRAAAGFWTHFMKGTKGPLLLFGTIFVVGALIVSQATRLEAIKTGGGESSFTERVSVPWKFVSQNWESQIIGSGATAHNQLKDLGPTYSRDDLRTAGRLAYVPDKSKGAFATTFIIFMAMGAIGLTIFIGGASLLLGPPGFILVGVFLIGNFITTGFNSAVMWVPCAILFSLCWNVLSQPGRSGPASE